MSVTIIIPTLNRRAALQRTLRSLVPEISNCQVLVADRGSEDGSAELVAGLGWPQWVETRGFRSEAVNAAAQQAVQPLLFVLFPGSVPARGWRQALQDGLQLQEADAGYLRMIRPQGLQTRAEQLSQRVLGGPRSLDGVFVRREVLMELGGFRPVPEFEWIAFSTRIKERGFQLKSLGHEVLQTEATSGAHRKHWWCDTLDDCVEAWKYGKTDALSPLRSRRQKTVAVVLHPGWDIETDSHTGTDEAQQAAQLDVLRQVSESLNSFDGVSNRACAAPSGVLVPPLEGFGPLTLKGATAEERVQEILAWSAAQGAEALHLIRPVSPLVDHRTWKSLSEANSGADAGIVGTTGGEWASCWIERPAPGKLSGWDGSASLNAATRALKAGANQVHSLDPVLGVDGPKQIKELQYRGVLA